MTKSTIDPAPVDPAPVDPAPVDPAVARPHRHPRLRIAAGWVLVLVLVVHAGWRGGIALDLMFTIMKVVGLFSPDEVLPFELDWWGMSHRAAAAGLAAYLAVVTWRYQRRYRGPVRGGWPPAAGQVAALASVVPALGYAALKLHWGLGGTVGLTDPQLFDGARPWSPGMGDTAVMALVGAAVALLMARGIATGRSPLPRWLLLTPAVVGTVLLLPVGLYGSVAVAIMQVTGGPPEPFGGLAAWVALGIYPTFLGWGILLVVATVTFHQRTRTGRVR